MIFDFDNMISFEQFQYFELKSGKQQIANYHYLYQIVHKYIIILL